MKPLTESYYVTNLARCKCRLCIWRWKISEEISSKVGCRLLYVSGTLTFTIGIESCFGMS